MDELLSHDALEFDLHGGPIHDRSGMRVGGITIARDRICFHERHQASAVLAVLPWVNSTRLGLASGRPVIDVNERVLGFLGEALNASTPDGACLLRGGWRRNLKTPDGKEVAVFGKVGILSQRWRIALRAGAAPELRGLALAAVFIDRAARAGN